MSAGSQPGRALCPEPSARNVLSKHWLKIGYWNIKGLKASDASLKTDDECVFSKIKAHDIICLSEVHCGVDDLPSISGYNSFKLCRGLNKKINRYFGGLVIYYKSELREGIKFIANKTSDYVWMKLNHGYFSLEKDIYLCMAYIPPSGSTYSKARGLDVLELIEQEVVNFANLGQIMILMQNQQLFRLY